MIIGSSLSLVVLKDFFIYYAESNSICRIKKDLAEEILFENNAVIISGRVRYFQIKRLTDNVYEAALRQVNEKNTILVKEFQFDNKNEGN